MNNPTLRDSWCGIDVSKLNFDGALENSRNKLSIRRLLNKPCDFPKLVAWAHKTAGPDVEVKFCLESTGDYGDELALYLTEHGYHVSVVNPARVKHYGLYKGRLNKTDKADAKLIAEFAKDSKPEVWAMTDPMKRTLFRLNRRRRQLTKMETAESNRRECPGAVGPECMKSINAILKTIRAELRSIEAQIASLVQSDEELSRDTELVKSIPALAEGSAHTILAEMPPVQGYDSAKSWAAASGMQPVNRQSGTSLKRGKMSKGGRRAVRGQLWMPTLAAIGSMPEIKGLYDRLKAGGKTHKQAMVACSRKLLMIVYAVLKHRKPYQSPERTLVHGT